MYNLCDHIQDLEAYFLLLGVLAPSCRLEFRSNIANYPFLSGWPTRIGASGPRLRGTRHLAEPTRLQPLDQSEEGPLPWVPG